MNDFLQLDLIFGNKSVNAFKYHQSILFCNFFFIKILERVPEIEGFIMWFMGLTQYCPGLSLNLLGTQPSKISLRQFGDFRAPADNVNQAFSDSQVTKKDRTRKK